MPVVGVEPTRVISTRDFEFLSSSSIDVYKRQGYGGLAQLGERLHGMQEVSGSIPLFSTKKAPYFV